jgi:hypothetical protein
MGALIKEKIMGLLNQVFQGNPNTLGVVASGGSAQAPNVAIDTVDGTLFMSVGNGWQALSGVVAKGVASAQVANNANVLTFTAKQTGLYRVDSYAVSTNVPGGGANAAVPGTTAAYTDADATGPVAITATVSTASASTVATAGVVVKGSVLVNVAAGGTIVLATTGYVAGGGTALQYGVKVRISYLG